MRNPSALGQRNKLLIDDSKSVISKVSRASSKSKVSLAHSNSGILSKEEKQRLAKEKKTQMDKIKKQYSQVSKPKSG